MSAPIRVVVRGEAIREVMVNGGVAFRAPELEVPELILQVDPERRVVTGMQWMETYNDPNELKPYVVIPAIREGEQP